jgi:hypothetical protein
VLVQVFFLPLGEIALVPERRRRVRPFLTLGEVAEMFLSSLVGFFFLAFAVSSAGRIVLMLRAHRLLLVDAMATA